MDIEPKQTVDKTADDFLDKLDVKPTDGEQPSESSPATEQPEVTREDGSDPAKTPSTENTDNKGTDKGFASHPAWIEREQKLKEAQAKLKEAEQSSQVMSKLLDDPRVYKKYLEAQGFRPEEIERAMLEKGFKEEPETTKSLDNKTKQNIAEIACEKLGWNINALTPEQRAYINDHVALTEQVIDQKLGSLLDSRLKPLEGFLQNTQANEKSRAEIEESKRLAMEEFPDQFKKDPKYWDSTIVPAMNRYLDELDKKDPKKTIKIDAQTLYERATRQILKERKSAEESQEARNIAKGNARPLAPGASKPQSKQSLKGQTTRETADKFFESIGFRE